MGVMATPALVDDDANMARVAQVVATVFCRTLVGGLLERMNNEYMQYLQQLDNTNYITDQDQTHIQNKYSTITSDPGEDDDPIHAHATEGHKTNSEELLGKPHNFLTPHSTYPPFYDFGTSPRLIFDGVEPLKAGGTSEVFRIKIYQNRMTGLESGEKSEISFAMKKIDGGRKQDYAQEANAYRQLRLAQNPHPHIVPLLASFHMSGNYHFIFPLADCDLAMYWRQRPNPRIESRALRWFAGQMRGLADALTRIHVGRKNKQETGSDTYGVHGDIKPENILCLDCDTGLAKFAFTDFGSSYFLSPKESHVPKGHKHTPVYRAPEIDITSEGITQAYDIWSLGCVFLEAIAWLYDGRAGIAKLIAARFGESNSPNRDAFFRLKYNQRGGLTAKLKPEIQILLASLRWDSRTTPFIDDMLYIVMEGMMKIDMNERISSRQILDALNQMCIKLEKYPAYSEPRSRDPDSIMGVAMNKAFSYNTSFMEIEYSTARRTSLTALRSQVHTQNASRQQLAQAVDSGYYVNLTTQSNAGTQVGLNRRFACPFYKAGIQISSHHRACEGPGFFDVNKAKEHLFRRHLEKEYRGKHICRRCYTGFKTDEFLQAHAHQEPPCSTRTPGVAKGMLSGEQAFQLRSLKRKSSKESDEDRWFDIYRIVFPKFDRKLENISPYHETNSTSLSTLNSSTSSNGISQYKDYLRNRDAEDYAAKLSKMGIDITAEAAAKVLELQVKDLENFDETMRETVQAYGFQIGDSLRKTGVEEGASATELVGSIHPFGPFQLLARYVDDKEH